jgi:hypothetical protein
MEMAAEHERFLELARFVNDLKPMSLEPLARVLPAKDMDKLGALDALGWFHRCTETGRIFCPRA